MPRTARASIGGVCYHVFNRGNAKAEVFHKTGDYDAFAVLMAQACERFPMRILGYCVMPNHFHLALWPEADGQLSRWMQWMLTTHVRRCHQHYGTSGHVWQGRFKAFPIEADDHLLTVLRYLERNPLRANLVERAEDWPWSSLNDFAKHKNRNLLSPWPVLRPRDWVAMVNQAENASELDAVRRSVSRGVPFGSSQWTERVVKELGLESSLRRRGRPRGSRSE